MFARFRVGSWNVEGRVHNGSETSAEPIRSAVTTHRPDILALQELSFAPDNNRSLEDFAYDVGLPHVRTWPLSQSHRREGHRLGLGILSRYPLQGDRRILFPNPEVTIRRNEYEEWTSHQRGLLIVMVLCGSEEITFGTTHLLPFHHFGRRGCDPEFAPSWAILAETMRSIAHKPSILAGDFNTQNLETMLPAVFESRQFTSLVHTPTRSSGEHHDNILCSACWKVLSVQVIPSITNHHICIADVTLNLDRKTSQVLPD